MTYYSKYVTKDLVMSAKKELKNLGQFSMLPIKLRAISACENNQIKDVALIIGFSKRSLTSWIKLFKDKGIQGLLNKSGRGRKSLFNDKITKSLEMSIVSDPNVTLKDLSLMIIKKHRLMISKSAIHNYLKRIGYSHVTSRPKHYQQDKQKLEQFKKKTLIEIEESNQDKEILYFDESRFGTHSKIGRSWRRTGIRSRVEVKLGFKNFYLYSAINSKNGEQHTLLLPYVNTSCMNLYLETLSENLKKRNKEALIIMDGAGWHKSKDLLIPPNIKIELLPPYCPELNPVERLWRYVKDHTIKNRVFENLKEIEDNVCDFIRDLSCNKILSICGQERS